MTRRNAGAGVFGRYSRLFPLRRSLSSQRIATGQKRHTDAECTKCPNASHPRCRRRTHFAALPAYGFAAERRPRIREIPTAIQWQHEESRIVNPMIPDFAAGSQQRSGRTHIHHARIARQVRSAHAPLAGKGRHMRTPKWRFAVGHGRHQPRSLA
jgi:hypothetical protein